MLVKRLSLLLLIVTAVVASVAIALDFPPLTDRVVDEANLLSPGTEAQLIEMLAKHERETSNEVAVVTLASLRGVTIEQYGYQLGREWGIGKAERNNGVVIIIAPNERKVRIEVGYGLEGVLTDLKSHLILQNLRQTDPEARVIELTQAVLGVLEGTYQPMPTAPKGMSKMNAAFALGLFCLVAGQVLTYRIRPRSLGATLLGGGTAAVIWFLLGVAFLAVVVGAAVALLHMITGVLGSGSHRGRGGGDFWGGSGYGGGSWGSYSGGGGGFSGGGGSFGGGGASGSW